MRIAQAPLMSPSTPDTARISPSPDSGVLSFQSLFEACSRALSDSSLQPSEDTPRRRDPESEADAFAFEVPIAPSRAEQPVVAPSTAPADPVMSSIIQTVVATDIHRRRVIMLRVAVEGRGDVHIRLRRGACGVEVRLRTDDPSLRSELRTRRTELEARARAAGRPLARIEIA